MHAEATLYLLPVWLGEHGDTSLLPARNIEVAERVKLFFCEDERTARRMLRRMSRNIDLGAIELHLLDKDTGDVEVGQYGLLLGQRDAAIISEAGMPCVADPGARLVAEAHKRGIRVEPLSGPSSLLLALAASGLNGQQFSFHGYLARDTAQRRKEIRTLEADAARTGRAHLFIETPYRNEALLADLLAVCQPGTRITLAVDLEQPGGAVATRTAGEWKKVKPFLGKRPCVFIIGQ